MNRLRGIIDSTLRDCTLLKSTMSVIFVYVLLCVAFTSIGTLSHETTGKELSPHSNITFDRCRPSIELRLPSLPYLLVMSRPIPMWATHIMQQLTPFKHREKRTVLFCLFLLLLAGDVEINRGPAQSRHLKCPLHSQQRSTDTRLDLQCLSRCISICESWITNRDPDAILLDCVPTGYKIT